MAAPYKFKLLSGALNGVEFTLAEGDTVFHAGAQSELAEGSFGSAFARAENTFYLPVDSSTSAFIIRVRDADEDLELCMELRLGRQDASGDWVFTPIQANAVCQIDSLFFAVRTEHGTWSAEVLDFKLPSAAGVPVGPVVKSARRSGALKKVWLVVAAVLILGGASYAVYRHYSPEAQVKGIETILQNAPAQYDVLHGKDGRVYAIADTPDAVAWGLRATKRLGMDAVFLERSVEVDRLAKVVASTGLEVVVVRLNDPGKPHVLLSRTAATTDAASARAKAALADSAPYAELILVTQISDDELVRRARDQLRALGISTTVIRKNGRTSVANDTYLDDARLNVMVNYIATFEHQWGAKRVTIHTRLWDDLLKGRSYQYGQDQLMSVGQGRWRYSSDVGRN